MAETDLIRRLSPTEYLVLLSFDDCDEERGFFSFSGISERSGVELRKIRRTARALARKGHLQYARVLWNEDGEMRGSGYGLTRAGREHLSALKAKEQS